MKGKFDLSFGMQSNTPGVKCDLMQACKRNYIYLLLFASIICMNVFSLLPKTAVNGRESGMFFGASALSLPFEMSPFRYKNESAEIKRANMNISQDEKIPAYKMIILIQ